FEYQLPNRTVTVCPTYSLVSLECPQLTSNSFVIDQQQLSRRVIRRRQLWKRLPVYIISIDYARSFPSKLGLDQTCQPDITDACYDYDGKSLPYLITLCSGKSHCSDIQTYQIRDRSLCQFKAVTEIGYHCIPTWYNSDIQTKCDICKNGSLTNDYGFIYSRNYPQNTIRTTCYTTIYARPDHKTVLYYVNGELNYDSLMIESISSDGTTILNITLNGNISTSLLAASTHEMRITFVPNTFIYSQHSTYYLLYFYAIPICSYESCILPPLPSPITTTSTVTSTTITVPRTQTTGWTTIPSIWIIIPIILGYILILLLSILIALCIQRRRRQRFQKNTTRYFDNGGISSRAQLVTPIPVTQRSSSTVLHRSGTSSGGGLGINSSDTSRTSFARNMDKYRKESRSDYDLHDNYAQGIRNEYFNWGHHPHRRSNQFQTMHDFRSSDQHRRSLPKSFSDCELCKRRVAEEEGRYRSFDHLSPRMERMALPNLFNRNEWHRRTGDDITRYQRREFGDWRLDPPSSHNFGQIESSSLSSPPRRTYREKIKERFRERLTHRKHFGNENEDPINETYRNQVHDGVDNKQFYHNSSSQGRKSMRRAVRSSTADLIDRQNVEYSTVLPRHIRQRTHSESNVVSSPSAGVNGHVRHLPVEYINEPKNMRTVEYRRNSSLERLTIGGDRMTTNNYGNGNSNSNHVRESDDNGTTNFTVKLYDHDDARDEREIQEMSVKMNEYSRERGISKRNMD
ncbi:unnamed protein product, partial [Didymodactylos carnosus]